MCIRFTLIPVLALIQAAPKCTPPARSRSRHHWPSAGEGPRASSAAPRAPATHAACPGAPGAGTGTSLTAGTRESGNFDPGYCSAGIRCDCACTPGTADSSGSSGRSKDEGSLRCWVRRSRCGWAGGRGGAAGERRARAAVVM